MAFDLREFDWSVPRGVDARREAFQRSAASLNNDIF